MNLETLRSQIIERYSDEAEVNFVTASDGANMVSEIIFTTKGESKVVGHIYKSFDENLDPTFIARYYVD